MTPRHWPAKQIGIALLVVLVVGLIVWQVTQPQEPLYKGKPLSYWVKDEYTRGNEDTKNAVHQIGTNGIPTLLRLLRDDDSTAKIWFMDQLERRLNIKYNHPALGHFGAAYAFGQLGTDAHAAVPELIKIADANISPTSQYNAVESVGYVGLPTGEAVPALLRWLTNSDATVRSFALSGLLRIDYEAYKHLKPSP